MSKPAATSKVFDPAKLEVMSEPLAVRVEKLKGNTRTPIPLPAGPDGSPQGENWSKEDVKGLEQWLVTDWSGGGMYAITVIDSSLPTPLKHDWQIFYNPQEYPEKKPASLSAPPSEIQFPQPLPQPSQQVRPMGSFPSVFPNGLPAAAQPQQPQQQQFQPFYPQTVLPQIQQMSQPQPNYAALASADAERRRYEEQLKAMQDQLARAREEQMQAQHRQELERTEARMRAEQQAQNEKFTKLEQLIAQIATVNARPVVDPQIEALKEQNRQLAAEREMERRERETERRERAAQEAADRRDREVKELVLRQQEDTRRQIEAMNTQLQLAAQNKGPDPMISVIQEAARQQVEAAREQARAQAAQAQQMQQFMMSPRDILAMAKESATGLDQATSQLSRSYTDIFNLQRQAVEMALQINTTGGSETIQLIEKGLERVSSLAERYVGGKTREVVTAQQSQAQLAQANAAAMTAQASAMATQAAMQRAQEARSGGLNGSSNGHSNGHGKPSTVTDADVAAAAQAASVPFQAVWPEGEAPKVTNNGWGTGPVLAGAPQANERRTFGRTDTEWFGPIMPQVMTLRDGVARFMESLEMDPHRLKEDGAVDGVGPDDAAKVILQAAMIVMQQQLPIMALQALLGQGRVAEFMDVLLPEAPQTYRDDVAQILVQELSGGPDDDEGDDEDDTDGDDGDESIEAAPVPAPAPVKAAKPAPRARA